MKYIPSFFAQLRSDRSDPYLTLECYYTEIEKARSERFAMRRERVAATVERHRETDPEYNPHHHMLCACSVDDVDVVQFLVEEEGVDIEVM